MKIQGVARLVFLIIYCFCINTKLAALEIIAHRGASYDAPENSLSAMKLGFDQGADACELDIHLTLDGELAVLHDFDTPRIGGPDKTVMAQTMAGLKEFNAGTWGKWQGKGFSEKIPALGEVLNLVPKGKKIFIEIKPSTDLLPPLEKSIVASGLRPAQVVLITFHFEVAQNAKKRFPNLAVYWLRSWEKDAEGQFPKIEDLIARAAQARLDGLNLNFKFPDKKEVVSKIVAAGMKCYIWTVNDPSVAREWVAAGAAGITTDRPEWLRQQLGK